MSLEYFSRGFFSKTQRIVDQAAVSQLSGLCNQFSGAEHVKHEHDDLICYDRGQLAPEH